MDDTQFVHFCSPNKLKKDAVKCAAHAGFSAERFNDNSEIKLRWTKCNIDFLVMEST